MTKYVILIIDDDPTQHLILGDYLKLAGYEVIHANSGDEGLKILTKRKPHLILMDIQMPGLDGFQVVEEIKKNASNRNIAILFLSGLDRRHLKIKGLELGADDYITKPFDRTELLARINAVLRRIDRTRQLEGVMEGDISDVGISDLLQSMELGLKTATIQLRDIDAEIVIKSGEVLHIRQGNFTGTEALIRIFLLEKGYFSINFNEIPPGLKGSPKSLTSMLMNVSNEVDEIKEIIQRLKVGEKKIVALGDLSEFPTIAKAEWIMPATFTSIIVAMEGTLKENINTLVAATKKKLIGLEKRV